MANINELEQRLNKLEKEKAAIRNQISQEKRKGDVKRKILYGAAALALSNHDLDFQILLLAYLDKNINRKEDRELLGLTVHEIVD